LFSATTYNILAQAYCRPERYRGVPETALERTARRRRLLDRIAALNTDLLCLQEVEPDALDAIRATLPHHDAHFLQKRDKPDGVATLYRRDRFALRDFTEIHYDAIEPGYDHVGLILELTLDGLPIAIGNTHLRWQKRETPAKDHLGRLQFLELLERMPNGARLIAGDFNAGHDSLVLREGRSVGLAMGGCALRPWDTALINGNRRKLDYLLYSESLFRPTPRPLPQLSRHAPIPDLVEPSDHLPLSVDFELGRA